MVSADIKIDVEGAVPTKWTKDKPKKGYVSLQFPMKVWERVSPDKNLACVVTTMTLDGRIAMLVLVDDTNPTYDNKVKTKKEVKT